jgi:dihydroxy-acid dehydratase
MHVAGSRARRARKVTSALKAYALLATSADKGAVRNTALLGD